MMKKILKWTLIVLGALILLIYIFNIDYIFKGVRTIYFTGNNTAFIADYEYFDNREIKSTNPQPWALHKLYNTVNESEKLKALNNDRKTKTIIIYYSLSKNKPFKII